MFRSQLAWLGVSALAGCSLSDLNALTAGHQSAAAGASAVAAGGTSEEPGVGGSTASDTLPLNGGAANTASAPDGAAGSAGINGAGASAGAGGGGGVAGVAGGLAGAAGSGQSNCPTGTLDCNGLPDDGCEIVLNSMVHCGTTCADTVTCPAEEVCAAGKCGPAQGLVKMSVPFTAAGQGQRYADKFPTLPNLTGTMLTLRVYAPGATGGILSTYLIDQDFTYGVGATTPLASMSQHWVDVVLSVGAAYGSFDPATMYQVSVEFQADAGPTWLNPTIIYLDSVHSSNGLVNDDFTTAVDAMIGSSMMVVAGSSMTWVDRLP